MGIKLSDIHRVHCIGIGGAGVSAVARMLRGQGKKVTGSDISRSPMVATLRKLGIRVFPRHRAGNVGDAELVVYTKAVGANNPELRAARKRNVPCLSYAEMLGVVSRDRTTIAIAGAHGKTTTTAMVGHILLRAGFRPTIVVGGIMANGGTNFVAGKGKYFVVEACEYERSFLDLNPAVAVITNIDNDHLDYYRNIRNIRRAFGEFVAKLPRGGTLVCDPHDMNVCAIARAARRRVRVVDFSRLPLRVPLKVFGEHHRRNARAALAVAEALGVSRAEAARALRSFKGVARRFERRGICRGVRFYDDYAHHPTEVRATLRAARQYFGPRVRIWCVFQPHLYSRTRLLMKDFAKSFKDADEVLLLDIYAAREKDDGKTNARTLSEKIAKETPSHYVGSFLHAAALLNDQAGRGDVVITMGAGEAYRVWDLMRGRKRATPRE